MPVISNSHAFVVGMTAILLATFRSASALSEDVVQLGGVRNVTAVVSESDGGYRVAVEMLSVKAFDPTTNKALNLSKGRAYAVQALAKHLKTGSLTIRGLEVRESGTKGKSFRLVAVVPHDGVSAEAGSSDARERHRTAGTAAHPPMEPNKAAQTEAKPRTHEIRLTADATIANFLDRKADYGETIAQLREAFCEEGNSLEKQSLKPDDFDDSIGSVEERAEAAFKAMARQVGKDDLLLPSEQKDLYPALKKAHTEVLDSLKSAVARFNQRQEKTKKAKEKKK
jgi:hypothetical protein